MKDKILLKAPYHHYTTMLLITKQNQNKSNTLRNRNTDDRQPKKKYDKREFDERLVKIASVALQHETEAFK